MFWNFQPTKKKKKKKKGGWVNIVHDVQAVNEARGMKIFYLSFGVSEPNVSL